MKKIAVVVACFFVLLMVPAAFAQMAKIIDVRGQTFIKKEAAGPWEKAKINMFLGDKSEVQTKENGQCILAFDEEQKNLLTVKENSHIKIANVHPGEISLPEGRVFALISNLAKAEKFEIRTPVAIAGARGTGWETAHGDGATHIEVFEDVVSVQGLDEQGQATGQKDVPSGFGMDVGEGGILGDLMPLGNTNSKDLNDLKEAGAGLEQFGSQGNENADSFGDLKDEQTGSIGDVESENLRQQEEERLKAPVEPAP